MSEQLITREQASDIALAAAKEACRQSMNETFSLLGVNLANLDDVKQFRADMEWAHKGRKISEATTSRIWSAIVGSVGTGIVIGLWQLFEYFIRKH